MTASAKRRRNRTLGAALAGILVLGAAPALGYAGWQVLKDSKAGTAAATLKEIAFPSTRTGMIAVVDDQNLVVSLAVLVLSPSPGEGLPAVGGTLVSIPTNANRAETATATALPVADSVINAGEEGLLADVESLMRVTINSDAVVDVDGLAALLTPVGDLTVSLPTDVVAATADGSTETLFVAGSAELSPADAAKVLVARDPGQDEARRLPNIRAVWTGLAAAVGPGIGDAAALTPEVTTFDEFMTHFLAGPIQVFNDLNTLPLTGSGNPDKLDIGTLDVASVVLLMASLAPSAMITPNPTLNFRIENALTQADIDAAGLVGMTRADVTRNLISRLLFLQGNVVSVSSAVYTLESKVPPDTTVVFSPGGLEPAELEAITDSLGELEFDSPPFVFPLVDIVIVVGRSFLTDMANVQAILDTSTTEGTTDGSTPTSDTTGDSGANPPASSTDTVTT